MQVRWWIPPLVTLCAAGCWQSWVQAQPAPAGPPSVGILEADFRPITEVNEFNGRIEAINRVNIVARVTAFLEKRLFEEDADVKAGAPLYLLERGPFEADLESKQSQVNQLQASLDLAKLTTERQRILLTGPAGQQSTFDSAAANQRSLEAQVQGAKANATNSQISLNYTDITSPIDGRVGRTLITIGNVVSPNSGTLTTVVSQDPMYVTFSVPVRQVLELRDRYASAGGFEAVIIKLKLPNGETYRQTGHLDFANNTITTNTDSLMLRGTIANPPLFPNKAGDASPAGGVLRELNDGEFVTVLLEGVQPVKLLSIPRSAVLSDQQGDYVFVVGADNKAEQRRITLGQSTAAVATVLAGLSKGDKVVVEGLQRVRPGQPVSPGPASADLLRLISGNMGAAAPQKPAVTGSSTQRKGDSQ